MEKIQVNENHNIFNTSSILNSNANKQGISYEYYLKNKINNQNKIQSIDSNFTQNKNIPFSLNMNSLYFNMLKYNFFNNNYRPYNTSARINSLLLDFNDKLKNEYDKEDIKDKNNSKNKIENKIDTEYDFTPLIQKLESQEDERFAKSRFLKFIKDINSKKIIINEEKNIIEENHNYIDINNNLKENENNINQIEVNELEELLNEAKKYMNYSREDLAINILEKILDDSLIKLEKNKKYLLKAYMYLIICHLNSSDELSSISFIIDLLNLIKDENIESSLTYNNSYLDKEFINKINRRDFDISNKEEYEQYEYNKNKIKEETENLIKNRIKTNNKEIYNETLLLLYGLILHLNKKYIEAEEAFDQLIILNEQNYFYYNILGVININQNKYEDAIKYYKKALEINGQYPKCLINYGVLLSNKGKYEESCRYIISALKIFEDIPEGWTQLLSNIIELNKDELICEINDRNLTNIEKELFKK